MRDCVCFRSHFGSRFSLASSLAVLGISSCPAVAPAPRFLAGRRQRCRGASRQVRSSQLLTGGANRKPRTTCTACSTHCKAGRMDFTIGGVRLVTIGSTTTASGAKITKNDWLGGATAWSKLASRMVNSSLCHLVCLRLASRLVRGRSRRRRPPPLPPPGLWDRDCLGPRRRRLVLRPLRSQPRRRACWMTSLKARSGSPCWRRRC